LASCQAGQTASRTRKGFETPKADIFFVLGAIVD
jgi:hypothetical protein